MEKKTITLSVALAVYNEEEHISECLQSVRDIADEIVIVDGGSSDRTLEAASKFHPKVIHASNPPIFHINKQKALDHCVGKWILQLDADEIVPKELADEIMKTIHGATNDVGFYIPRHNYFWGHRMKKGGLYPDYVIRLMKKGKAKFPCKSVHEQIEIDGKVGYLMNPMKHIAYMSDRDYWRKADAYTNLTAQDLFQSKKKASWIRYNFTLPIRTFFSIFIRHKGLYDGWYGFKFALYSALHFPIAYRKYLAIKHSS